MLICLTIIEPSLGSLGESTVYCITQGHGWCVTDVSIY